MGSTTERDETPAAPRAAGGSVSVEPWDFWERPFTHQTDQLDTFVLFLAAEACREWEIHYMAVEDGERAPSLAELPEHVAIIKSKDQVPS